MYTFPSWLIGPSLVFLLLFGLAVMSVDAKSEASHRLKANCPELVMLILGFSVMVLALLGGGSYSLFALLTDGFQLEQLMMLVFSVAPSVIAVGAIRGYVEVLSNQWPRKRSRLAAPN